MKRDQDKNFDKLIEKFEKKIYNTDKGHWRLKLIKEDLESFYQSTQKLTIWDAGCGFAQISLWLAERGHIVTLCDLSKKMLERAKQQFDNAACKAVFYHQAVQTLATELPQFDLVLCHAVIEWLAEPQESLEIIAHKVKAGGHLSLLFYNRNAMIYTNVLKGGWRWQHLLNNSYLGKGSKLTPPNPQYPHEIEQQLQSLGFQIIQQTGIRVFHDYLDNNVLAQSSHSELFELEYRYCRMPTYCNMGRYIHLLAQKTQ